MRLALALGFRDGQRARGGGGAGGDGGVYFPRRLVRGVEQRDGGRVCRGRAERRAANGEPPAMRQRRRVRIARISRVPGFASAAPPRSGGDQARLVGSTGSALAR